MRAFVALLLLVGVIRADEPAPTLPVDELFQSSSDAPAYVFETGNAMQRSANPADATDLDLANQWTPAIGDSCLGCDGILGCDECFGCDGSGGAFGNDCKKVRYYIGLDFAVLRPHVDSLSVPGTGASIKPKHGYEIAPRIYTGFETNTGLGGHVSYWTLQTTGDNLTSIPQIANDLRLQAVDVDLTQSGQFGNWAVQAGAGVRWGKVKNDYYRVINPSQRLRTDFQGTGPTFLLNVRRPMGCGSWALVGEGRASFLFGDSDINSPIAPNLSISSNRMDIWEVRGGVEWTGTTASGKALFFVRGLLESQWWNVPGISGVGSADLRFLGPAMSAGFVF